MVRLERLRPEHAEELLAFERENRAYFARTVPDRGDTYFEPAGFAARHRALLAEQDAGICHFHLVYGDIGGFGDAAEDPGEKDRLIGRINLMDAENGSAELGYRVGRRAAGRGVATAAVAALCDLAPRAYGLSALTAVTTLNNLASRTVLERNGFCTTGEVTVGGRPGIAYRRAL
ncbi:ribosomal-protein-alanine N-acetyltransferase [Streptomyces sp. DI166]|uniref:GNAT family N-acetyltransferase n=1 Tax=Streptomyces sp. DI166 TaxID=1839783 RepID=UPI0007F550DA|nr:GNAT family N-acetyltransferase [Streptomyces sp. DI166]SBT94788.1 ribosomal-protein-alanine N-acetyltransferase [Streptomyces sp. DI166]